MMTGRRAVATESVPDLGQFVTRDNL